MHILSFFFLHPKIVNYYVQKFFYGPVLFAVHFTRLFATEKKSMLKLREFVTRQLRGKSE